MAAEDSEFDSTLIRRGNQAATFSEMVAFAELIEHRPLARLLEELPSLAAMSQTKFDLASGVLRRRFRHESDPDRQQLQAFAGEIADGVRDPRLQRRIRDVFRSDPATAPVEERLAAR